MKKIRPFIGSELIKVITGIRRSGKSVLLELIQEELIEKGISSENILSFNFEEMKNAHLGTAEALYKELCSRIEPLQGKVYLFFDEIQMVNEWEKCINACRVEFDSDIYITGSNAKLLSGELATNLAGRYVEFIMYPFSFSEFIHAREELGISKRTSESFNDYVRLGGMPPVTPFAEMPDAAIHYLGDIYNSVVLKDIVKRNNIRNVDLLERIIAFVFDNIGRPVSATNITNYFKSEKRTVSNDTVLNHIRACENAFLFYSVPRMDLTGKKLLSVNEKYYIADHGMREAIFGRNTNNIEQILENIVYMELLRRGYKVTVGISGAKEVDFVAEKKQNRIYIQVSYLLASESTVEREFGAYKGIADNYPKYVVTMDEFDMSRDGIKHFNLREFLLMENWE